MVEDNKLDITQSSDFHYLLELMLPLYGIEEYTCLPELFSIVGHEKLLLLCKYAGGATIKIPTLEELNDAIAALEWYYLVYISKRKYKKSIPDEYVDKVNKIKEVIDAQINQSNN